MRNYTATSGSPPDLIHASIAAIHARLHLPKAKFAMMTWDVVRSSWAIGCGRKAQASPLLVPFLLLQGLALVCWSPAAASEEPARTFQGKESGYAERVVPVLLSSAQVAAVQDACGRAFVVAGP